MKPITVLIADANSVIRIGFKKLLSLELDLEVVGVAKDGRQAVAGVKKLRPALVLMDVSMPLLNGWQASRQIVKCFPGTRVLMLSHHREDAFVAEAIHCGARGYLLKHTAADHVGIAIREVHKGNTYFSPSISRPLYPLGRSKAWAER